MRLFRWWFFAGFVLFTGCSPAPRPAPPVKLTILGLTLQAGAQLQQDAIEEFTRKTGNTVELIPTPGTSSEQTALILKLLSRHATTPDIYMIDIVWPGTLHEHLLDLTPYLSDEAHKHVPALLEIGSIKNRIVSLPFYMNTGILYYRSDLLKKYGYAAPPKTWEELASMALLIQKGERQRGNKDFWGYIWQGAEYEGLTCNALEWQASFGGGRILEGTGQSDRRVTVNNPNAVRAMKNAARWVGSISPASVLSYTESDTLNVFTSGNAAFLRHWSSALRGISEATRTGAVGVGPLPAGPAGRSHTVGGFHLAVSRYSAQPDAAAALVLYLTGIEVQTRRALKRGYIPTYAQLYPQPDLIRALPQSGVLQEISTGGWIITRPSKEAGNKYAEVSKAYYESVHRILAGGVRAESALAALEEKLSDLIGVQKDVSGLKNGP